MHLKNHFLETKELLHQIHPGNIARWFFEEGYYPERYVLPPSFRVTDLVLQEKRYNKDLGKLSRRELETISYPKSLLTARQFGVMHPWNYHDIVFHLYESWSAITEHLFPDEQRIYSYSFPIPVTKKHKGRLGQLRAGRMIYEWLAMAEKDLILDAGSYRFIARTDISTFYGSIYTHSIPWALHGRENALKDTSYELVGSKIDRLLQYANDARTNGIPVGSALTDLIAEIILAAVDVEVSRSMANVDFTAARFKDDYRFLCRDEEVGHQVIQCLGRVLDKYNLSLNERKTSILKLPDGLYRPHDREYFPYSLRQRNFVSFKDFEHTLLVALDIHRRHPNTSILEKFINELMDRRKAVKVRFSSFSPRKFQEIEKMIELLFFAKRESQKLLCHVLAVCEQLYLANRAEYPRLKDFLRTRIMAEIEVASAAGSTFEIVWYVFFSRFLGLGITGFNDMVDDEDVKDNSFYKCAVTSTQKIFADSAVSLFVTPKKCRGTSLARQVAAFG